MKAYEGHIFDLMSIYPPPGEYVRQTPCEFQDTYLSSKDILGPLEVRGQLGRRTIFTTEYRKTARWLAEEIPVPKHRKELHDLQEAIRTASADPDPNVGIRKIDMLWANIDEASNLAEARMRILLRKVTPPELALEPGWLTERLGELKAMTVEHPADVPVAAIDSAALLIRAVMHACKNPALRPEIEPGPMRSVEVQWDEARTLSWLVYEPTLPWPGVYVRVYVRPDLASPKLQVKPLHQAFGVIEQAVTYLR